MLSCFLYVTSFLTDRLRGDDRGAALVEYGLLVGLIAVVCIVAIQLLGTQIAGFFNAITTALTAA
jgi:pilus assembly protein Flp/PilA